MAHAIDTTTGKAAFVSLRRPAWHGLGTVLEVPASIEDTQKLAGLDWNVERSPIFAKVPEIVGIGPEGDMLQGFAEKAIGSHIATRRSDTGAVLGVVGADWVPVQNVELFDWVRQLSAWGNLTIETAGAMHGGATVWILVRMDDLRWNIDQVDQIKPYLLISNGHAGQRAVTINPVTERVVCANTLRMADSEADKRMRAKGNGLAAGWKIHHTTDVKVRMEEARRILAGTTDAWAASQREIQRLADAAFDETFLASIVERVWKGEDDDQEEGAKVSKGAETRKANRLKSIRELLSASTNTTTSAKGTVWGALNAITEYVDHDNTTRTSAGRDPREARFFSTQFGRGDVLKSRAWGEMRGLVKARPMVSVP
ncbi:MAG: DUF932 domain-containing protein [Planctomycetes bacterium]|nr:DUF932 domain-containing protein [Planctomycetota bacterium]